MIQTGRMPRLLLSFLPFLYLAAVLLPLPTKALYSARSDVVQLTEENFKEKVLKAEGVVLVEFYAAWCGHCKNLVPEWEKAAQALKGVVTVAAVDASVHQGLGQKYDVKGFPTIKVFGGDKRKPGDYQGGRTAKDIVNEGLGAARALVKERLNGGGGREGGLTTGKESTAPLPPGALKVVKATPWDGREPPVVEEEEFSLEDIMAEEL
ncbi:hypothetical protein NSK_007418 [Nannochloropsis salina CCMP1776]|uniref:protein disulfide-isomerase n=1 Tax=Nannochloropsis salina CCMP1776 TaxID=1027361 RepID=A0A4D9CTT8_9STRA|nr:hypothetical protein NSK_007418 [Nannochloropsis salina CCMP1776]|eukprot:TFJ81457.1 hypothetical protein NSK_007418 [Nannochloropsis salina CCMP1776]